MRKINLCYFLFVGVLVSCTNTYDVCEMQRNETEDMSSRMAGDGVYDVLGFGYDITEDYLGENSTRLQVIDVKALIRDNGDRFYNPFIGTIDQKIVAGEDAQSFLQNVITDSNFKGSVAQPWILKKMLKDSFLALFPLDLSLPLNIHILLNILLLKQK